MWDVEGKEEGRYVHWRIGMSELSGSITPRMQCPVYGESLEIVVEDEDT